MAQEKIINKAKSIANTLKEKVSETSGEIKKTADKVVKAAKEKTSKKEEPKKLSVKDIIPERIKAAKNKLSGAKESKGKEKKATPKKSTETSLAEKIKTATTAKLQRKPVKAGTATNKKAGATKEKKK
ncbi:MAG: hypothetical protein ACK4ND_06385 [Cytophagaceae bacterium]